MELPDNILRHYLRRVYFVAGGMCGGKTTISACLARKYGLTLYNWDEMYSTHKAISDPQHQPEMHRHGLGGDWEAYFSRPPNDYAAWLERSSREQVDIAVVDLLQRADDGPIVVDGSFPCAVLERISSPERCVFLFATRQVMARDNFQREDKRDLQECISRLRDPQRARENVLAAAELATARERECVRLSPFTSYLRDLDTDDDSLRRSVEERFGFIPSRPA